MMIGLARRNAAWVALVGCLLLVLLAPGMACRPRLPKVGSKVPAATFTSMADGSSVAVPAGLEGRTAMLGFWSPG